MFSFKTVLACSQDTNHPHLCFNDHVDTSRQRRDPWRLEPIVNDLGRAFLKVNQYLESDSDRMKGISSGD